MSFQKRLTSPLALVILFVGFVFIMMIPLILMFGLIALLPVLFLTIFAIIFSIDIIRAGKPVPQTKLVNEFVSLTSVDGNTLVLPELSTVEYGLLKLTIRLSSSGRYTTVDSSLLFENSKVVETQRLDLSDLCNQPYFIYSDSIGNSYITAPAFIVKSGRYANVIGICLNHEAIQEKTVDPSAQDPLDFAQAKLTIRKSGYRGDLWLRSQSARGARLEICLSPRIKFGVYSQPQCVEVARVSRTETTNSGEYLWKTS